VQFSVAAAAASAARAAIIGSDRAEAEDWRPAHWCRRL